MSKVCRYENDMLNQLPPELREACRKVWSESLDGTQYVIQHKYALGLLVKQTLEYEKSHEGCKGILTKIQEILHISSKRILDRTLRFINIFTQRDIQELTQVTQSGFCLSWSHFDYAMVGYLNKEKMLSYLLYAKKYAITPIELYKIIKKDYCRTQVSNRQKKTPASAKQFVKEVGDYVSKFEAVDKLLADIPADVITAWKSEIDSKVLETIVAQLEDHLTKCYLLKSKLLK